jgi:hypothetical protein
MADRTSGVKDTHAAEPVGEIVLFGGDLKEVSWRKGKMPAPGTKLYAHPPAGVDVPRAPSGTEAMRLALAALEKSVDNFQANVQHRAAIVALRAALAADAQAVHAPLTDEQLEKVLGAAYRKLVLETGYSGGMGSETWDRAAARAVEAAHGIGAAGVGGMDKRGTQPPLVEAVLDAGERLAAASALTSAPNDALITRKPVEEYRQEFYAAVTALARGVEGRTK